MKAKGQLNSHKEIKSTGKSNYLGNFEKVKYIFWRYGPNVRPTTLKLEENIWVTLLPCIKQGFLRCDTKTYTSKEKKW